MNILEAGPNTESSHTISFKGYSEDKEDMILIQNVLDLNSTSAAARVAIRVTKSLCSAIDHDPILSEFFSRITVNQGLPRPRLVLPAKGNR